MTYTGDIEVNVFLAVTLSVRILLHLARKSPASLPDTEFAAGEIRAVALPTAEATKAFALVAANAEQLGERGAAALDADQPLLGFRGQSSVVDFVDSVLGEGRMRLGYLTAVAS